MNADTPEFLTITDAGIKPVVKEVKLVPGDDPILKEVMPNFVFGQDDPVALANILIEMLVKYKGLGLSANQIGLRKRCFIAGTADGYVAYFNPEITWSSEETELKEEGCLSYPGLFVKVRRPTSINVIYYDYNGELHSKCFEGLTARVVQHEVDHLNGITFQDRAGKMALTIAKKKMQKGKNKSWQKNI
jgi:peptide deformylase